MKIKTTLKTIMKAISASVMIVGLSIVNAAPFVASFTDIEGHWGEEYVADVVEAGIMAGMGDGTFAPYKAMTYGEFAVVMTKGRFYGDTLVKSTDTHWADPYLNLLIFENCFETSTGVSVIPNDANWKDMAMPRYAMVTVLANVLSSSVNTSVVNQYSDITSFSKDYTEEFARVIQKGIMTGVSSTEFGVYDSVTRAAACVVVNNMLSQGLMMSFTNPVNGDAAPSTTTTTTGSTTTTTNPTTITGSTTTTTSSAKPTTTGGTAPLIFMEGIIAENPDDAVAGSGQYDVNKYSVPADTNKDGWITYREVFAIWAEIATKYPFGSSWTNDNYYRPISTSIFRGARDYYGCAAYAAMCSDLIFGNLPSRAVTCTTSSHIQEVIRPGDVIVGTGHWQIIAGTTYSEQYPAVQNYPFVFDANPEVGGIKLPSTYTQLRDMIATGTATSEYFTRYPAA